MAIYSLSVKSINRKSNQSAVAAAAYRSCSSMTDTRTGETYNFKRKHSLDDPSDAFIIAPAGAEWASDRSTLWNAAEAAENRGNSTTAREWLIALPAELTVEERRDLTREFATALVDEFEVAADVAIHSPNPKKKDGDERNFHAHILSTTRFVNANGLGKKTRDLDTIQTSKVLVEKMRGRWAEMVNEALSQKGLTDRVDHRSLERQGIDRIPMIHLGPAATAVMRRNQRTDDPAKKKPQMKRLEIAKQIDTANRIKRMRASDVPAPEPIQIERKPTVLAAKTRPTAYPEPPKPARVNRKAAIAAAKARKTTPPTPEPIKIDRKNIETAAKARTATPPAPAPLPLQRPEMPYTVAAFRTDHGLADDWNGISFPMSHRDRNGWHPRPDGDNLAKELAEKDIPHTVNQRWISLTIETLVQLGKEAARLMLERARRIRQNHQVQLRRENDRGWDR